MADRRMFTQKIIDSDSFLDMPLSAQSLYFHLNMRADDDGFINNPKKIQRMIGATEDDLKLLFAKRFVLGFESGVIVIKHWRMHNLIRKDRYHPTVYQEEMAEIGIKENGSYTEKIDETLKIVDSETLTTDCQPNDNQMATEVRLGKVRLGKVRLDNTKDKKSLDYDFIVDKFNSICSSLPKVTILSEKRKKAMDKVFVKEKVIGLDYLDELFNKVEESDFLSGRSSSWKANFDWVMNPTNIAKIIDGNYTNNNSKKETFNNSVKDNAKALDDFYSMASEWAEE